MEVVLLRGNHSPIGFRLSPSSVASLLGLFPVILVKNTLPRPIDRTEEWGG
jgi:hypothetical protein